MQLQTEVKEWRLEVRRGGDLLHDEMVTKKKMQAMLAHMATKPQHIMLDGFGTACYREIHFTKPKEKWAEFDKYTQEVAKRNEFSKMKGERQRLTKWLEDNRDKARELQTKALEFFKDKEWFTKLTKEAQKTLLLSKMRLLIN